MTTYTPGPWFVNDEMRHEKWVITAGEDVEICQDRGWGDGFEQEDLANARLIAAAPELLEALIRLVAAMRSYEADAEGDAPVDHHNMMDSAELAIAKATGAEA